MASHSVDYSHLADAELISWFSSKTGLSVERLAYGRGHCALDAYVFRDLSGRTVLPAHLPYLPLVFRVGHATVGMPNPGHQKLLGALAKDLTSTPIKGGIPLPPSVSDVRPFQWAGLLAEVRYTYTTGLPYCIDAADKKVRKRVVTSAEQGLTFDENVDLRDVWRLLATAAKVKRYKLDLTYRDLSDLCSSLGLEKVRVRAVRSADGEVVSAGIRLSSVGATALGWMQATNRTGLQLGAAAFMQARVLSDLATADASSYDFIGANRPFLESSKGPWNMDLQPYYVLQSNVSPAVRALKLKAKTCLDQGRQTLIDRASGRRLRP